MEYKGTNLFLFICKELITYGEIYYRCSIFYKQSIYKNFFEEQNVSNKG